MKIDCTGQWGEALRYFLSMDTARKLRKLHMRIRKMDWRTETVYLEVDGEERTEDYLKSLAAISCGETKCIPEPAELAYR